MKKYIMIMFVVVLLAVSVSAAMEWDNVGVYDKDTKTIDIRNALGFPIIGDSIAEVQLIRNTDKCVYHCSAVMKLTLKEDYEEPLQKLLFENTKGSEIDIKSSEINFIEYEDY